ncbi:hypothetical protein, partial [Rathayibacter tritici]|uniref:hypothetical protein n=1 Tax=Rathayibacter tritici TaxID=33888 RepID=UPI001CA58672
EYFPRELDIPGLPFGHRGNPTNSAVVQKEWGTSRSTARLATSEIPSPKIGNGTEPVRHFSLRDAGRPA